MESNKDSGQGSAVYSTHDICRLFNTDKNQIRTMIADGTIPEPLPARPKGKRLWPKARVDQVLGIGEYSELNQANLEAVLRKIVHEVIDDYFKQQGWDGIEWDRLITFLKNHDKQG